MRQSTNARAVASLQLAFIVSLSLGLSSCALMLSGIRAHMAPTTKTRLAVIDAAAARLGARYRTGATGPKAFDDNGLVQYAYAQAGIELPLAPRALLGAGEPVSLTEARPADLVFFRTDLAGSAERLRVGLFLNESEMLYASPRAGKVVIQPIDSDYWTGRLLGAVRVLP